MGELSKCVKPIMILDQSGTALMDNIIYTECTRAEGNVDFFVGSIAHVGYANYTEGRAKALILAVQRFKAKQFLLQRPVPLVQSVRISYGITNDLAYAYEITEIPACASRIAYTAFKYKEDSK